MKRKRVLITGLIVELDWDEDGHPTAWGVESEDDTYQLAESGKAERLAKVVGGRVRVTGMVDDLASAGEEEELPVDLPILRVESYEVLDEPGSDGEDKKDEDEEEKEPDEDDKEENEDEDEPDKAYGS